ncbi:triosephosphate isomerase [Microlunatus endophyticus]|uniref:Triosephosphate isomerase n=1 Tax=Microlunatus endophyticus TaxID=1716077 RepID=A0A917W1R5_9ACTN|nr:triose-phosphate isomerase family protein [Microlunatus endophyticus]GGL51969.1 triosephosphate isomerase [Microlunatus endophyticus]
MAAVFLGVSLKMYLDHATTLGWVRQVMTIADRAPAVAAGRVELAVLPTFVSIEAVAALARDTAVAHGAQDLGWADQGAFTGEVSGADLAALGCRYVEVGHAERRRLFGEDDAIVAAKFAAAVRNGLVPILCVGETERIGAGAAIEFCVDQVRTALDQVEWAPELIIAYEPVWAIGADRPAGVDHVRTVCAGIRAGLVGDHRLSTVRVIYGGSAGPGLLTQLGREAVDGLFLGRFAHDPAAMATMVDEASALAD